MSEYGFQWTGRRTQGEFIGYAAPGARWNGDVDVIIKAAEHIGVDIKYRAEARGLIAEAEGRAVTGLVALIGNSRVKMEADAVIIAAGGFESSTAKRTAYMGANYDDITVRRVRYNTGEAIDMALAIGAQSEGNWSGSPRFNGERWSA